MNWMRTDDEGNTVPVTVVEDLGTEVVLQVLIRDGKFAHRTVAKETPKQRYCKDNLEVIAWNNVCRARRIEVLREKMTGLREKLAAAERELETLTGVAGTVNAQA